jgi:hypothetical protein
MGKWRKLMSSIIFENEGLINVRAIKTFGVNVKETENPFGYFGTGLKYAIAIILRNHCKITLYRGESEKYIFSLKPTDIRNKQFSIITMNGEELGFTSELGKNWELWQAYRELYCNTLDENGDIYVEIRPITPQENKTLIVVEGESFLNVHYKRREFILQSDPIEIIDNVEIHEGPGKGFFYKNILVGGISSTSRYIYNITDRLELTEDRTVKSLFNSEWTIVKALVKSKYENIIEDVVLSNTGQFEDDLHFGYINSKPGEVFLSCLKRLSRDYSKSVNDSALILFHKYSKEDTLPKPTTMTVVQQRQLEKACAFCNKVGLFEYEDFPIVVAETLGKGILGLAKKGTIYIAIETFDMGTKMVAITLIEEYIHLKHGHPDMTRSMQNHLFNKIITLGEELNEEPL